MKKVGIVGSGLAAFCCALELTSFGGYQVDIFEKRFKVGGNTRKAIGGLNSIGTCFSHPDDSPECFLEDTLKSGRGESNEMMVRKMIEKAPEAIEFLENCGVTFTQNMLVGGHSYPRLHGTDLDTTKGFAFGEYLIRNLEKNKIKGEIFLEHEVIDVNRSSDIFELDVRIENEETEKFFYDELVIAVGGYSANSKMIKEYHDAMTIENLSSDADPLSIPTTNGDFATGDILPIISDSFNANLVHMNQIQIHPTSAVNPKSPDQTHVLLISDTLRGLGAILVDETGTRFVDEKSTRDVVANGIFTFGSKSIFGPGMERKVARLIFDSSMTEIFGEKKMNYYRRSGVVSEFGSLEQLAELEGLISENLYESVNSSNFDGGKVEMVYVTPAYHHTMGGLEINEYAQILDNNGDVIPNLYAAGESVGGIHGCNRLGGNALLECVVFGRQVAHTMIDTK